MLNRTTTSRRSLILSGAIALALGPGSLAVPASAQAGVGESSIETLSCDVAVIGAGAAGLAAAVTAAEKGASVLLIEKMNMVGGNSILSEDAITALDDPESARWSDAERNEILTERDALLAEMRSRGKTVDPSLDARMIDLSSSAVEWLRSLGCSIVKTNLRRNSRHIWEYRSENGALLGNEMIRQLLIKAEHSGVKILTGTRITALRPLEDGHSELLASGRRITAHAVIIATGGFAGSLEAVRRNCPDCPPLLTTNVPGATGDGLDLARGMGADFVDLDAIMLHPTTHALTGTIVSRPIRMNGAILLNNRGERFINELDDPEQVADAILAQPGACAWLLCDSDVLERDLLERLSASASISSASTLSQLADLLGVSLRILTDTIAECRATRGLSEPFARPEPASRFTSPPFYAIRIRPAIHGSLGGIHVNAEAQVLSPAGNPLPGLYAAGEITGGVYGRARFDNFGLTGALVFGRLAGENAAREAIESRRSCSLRQDAVASRF